MAWSDMEPKQKGVLIATIIIFIIIGYMVYRVFFAGTSPAPAPVKKAPVTAAKPQQAPPAANNNAASDLAVNANSTAGVAASTVNTSSAVNAVPQVVEMPKRELTPEELNLLEERRQVQQQYLQLVNQYQLMEMQNKVATSQSSLIKTQLETAKSEQQATKLGILLPGQQGPSDVDKSLSGVSLVYVGKKNGVWSAVLNLRGQYATVKVGSHLPDDSVVSTINDNGIVLYKDGERRTLTVATVVEQTSDDSNNGDGSNTDSSNADSSNSGG